MARGKGSDDGGATGVGAAIFGVLVLIAAIPKEVWIVLGITAGIAIAVWIAVALSKEISKSIAEAKENARRQRAEEAAAAERKRIEDARREKRRRIETMGSESAAWVDFAEAWVTQIASSEAAREGWLGDIEFSADIAAIMAGFQKAYALDNVAGELSVLDNPSADDRKILQEAKTAVAALQTAAIQRVELIGKCAAEAGLVDASLRKEREDAHTAEQRAELHGKLSAMLYGVEAAPNVTPVDSAADRVLSRVAAYREIKKQIELARDR